MTLKRIAALPANDSVALEPLDLTIMQYGMSPATMEMMGILLIKSAARLRAIGYTSAEARV